MAEDLPPVYLEFRGNIAGIQESIRAIEGELKGFAAQAETAGRATDRLGAKTKGMSMLMTTALVAVGFKAIEFAKHTVGAFGDVGKEVIQMQRVLGGSAEDMSRLRFAGEEVGVSTDKISTAMKIFSKNVFDNSKNIKDLGMNFKDSQGNIKPSMAILQQLGDHFRSMPNGMVKTAEAVKLFGRNGVAMLPLLNQGSEGMKKFAEEADKFGLTLSQKDLDASRKFSLQTKQMHAAVEGLQVSIGRAVVPALTAMARTMTAFVANNRVLVETIMAVVTALGAMFVAVKLAEGISKIYIGVQKAMVFVTNLWSKVTRIATAVTAAFNTVMGILSGEIALVEAPVWLVIAAIAGLIEIFFFAIRHSQTFAKFLVQGIEIVGKIYGTVIKYIIKGIQFLADYWLRNVSTFLRTLAKLQAPLNAVGLHFADGLSGAADKVDQMRNTVDGKLTAWANSAPAVGGRIGRAIGNGIVKAANFDVLGWIKSRFAGQGVELAKGAGQGDASIPASSSGSGDRAKKRKAIDQALALIKEINAAISLEDSKFRKVLAQNENASYDERRKIVKDFMAQNAKVIALAKSEEEKTRGTRNHAAAVKALANATKEQAKMQAELNKINKEAAKALADQADAQSRLLRLQQTASSWLQAHSVGLQVTNTGSVIVPVNIDGREVFRAVQKQSTQNSRRNISNGLTFTGAVL